MQHGFIREPRKSMLPNTIQDDVGNASILHNAVATGDDKKLQTFLCSKMDRTVKEPKYGNTPLHESAMRGYSRCIRALCLSPHARVEQKEKEKKKKKILKNESKVSAHRLILNIQNNNGCTALHLAAQNGHNQSCRELLLAGADSNVQNNYGDTALHTACRYGHAGATRILLSAFCNPNKLNLNRDTALHISCAMGKRKLTRILFEADCDVELRNVQDERPLDIAIRKKHSQILEILNNSHSMSNRRDKHNGRVSGRKDVPLDYTEGCVNSINWSPYGCHYFPDPRIIPSARFETFPKEPLKPGEQYYLDLAGRIRKGPIGVGNTCYCGPFFRHIEDKLNINQINMPKLIRKAKKCLGQRVHRVPVHTQAMDQRTRLFPGERHFDMKWKHIEALDLTAPNHKSKTTFGILDFNSSLTRCRSLELISTNNLAKSRLRNSQSCGLLENYFTACQIGRQRQHSAEAYLNKASTSKAVVDQVAKSRNWHQLEIDYYNLMESLAKRTERVTMKNIPTREEHSYSYLCQKNIKKYERDLNVNELIRDVNDMKLYQNEPNRDKILLACCESNFGKRSAFSSEHNDPENSARLRSDNNLPSSGIFAKRNLGLNQSRNSNEILDIQHSKNSNYQKSLEMQVRPRLQTEISSYDDFQVPSSLEVAQPVHITDEIHKADIFVNNQGNFEYCSPSPEVAESDYQKSFNLKRRPFCGQNIDLFQNNTNMENGVNGIIEKVEIRNSEIKLLKKPKCSDILNSSKVRDLIAHMEEKANLSKLVQYHEKANAISASEVLVDSESSEDEPTCQSTNIKAANNSRDIVQQARLHAPKDAYFHELPHKKRNYGVINERANICIGPATSSQSIGNSLESPVATRNYIINNAVIHPADRLQSTIASHPVRTLLSPTISHSDASFVSSDYELYNQKNYRLLQQQPKNLAEGQKKLQMAHMLQECHNLVERDFSNDSGYCTQPYGGSHLLGSNNTTHTDCALRKSTSPTNLNFSMNHADRSRPDINGSGLLPYHQFGSNEGSETVDFHTGYVSHLV